MRVRVRFPPRTPGQRRALGILGSFLAFVALGQLVASVLLDTPRLLEARFPQIEEQIAAMRARGGPPDILFFGSSRFEGGVQAWLIEKIVRDELGVELRAFNAAVSAGDPLAFDRQLRDYRNAGVVPRNLVVEVSPETVARRVPFFDIDIVRQLTLREIVEIAVEDRRTARFHVLAACRLIPVYKHRQHFWRAAGIPVSRPAPEKVPEPPKHPDLEASSRAVSKWLSGYDTEGVATRRLRRLLAACRAAGIQVTLLGVPVSSPHRRAYTAPVDAGFLRLMGDLSREFGCRYADYRSRIPDAQFADNHHLDGTGSVTFTRMLASEVAVPLVRERERVPGPESAGPGRRADASFPP